MPTEDASFEPFETDLDRQDALSILRDATAQAEDGELFLERRRSESLTFDDRRLRGRLPRPVTKPISIKPAAIASSTPYCTRGLLTMGSISLGMDLVAGRNLVPYPATGNMHFLIIKFATYFYYKRTST